MKNVHHMMLSRALFFNSISRLMGEPVVLDENFLELLNGFIHEYLGDYYKAFNLILCIKETDHNTLKVYEDDSWEDIFMECMQLFNDIDDIKVREVYEEIGYENVDTISRLAELYIEYKMKLEKIPYVKIKQ